MQLFYNAELTDQNHFRFDKNESTHIIKVLRKKNGDILHITNGLGFLFEAEVILDDIRNCEVKIIKKTFFEPSSFQTHIAIAPTKMNDRLEWFVEKAVEIGVHEITPIICDNSERKVLKTERIHKIAAAAMKQSLQYYLPKINEPVSYKTFMQQNFESTNLYIAHCEEDKNKKHLFDLVTEQSKNLVLIGPEGDFSNKEITLAKSGNFQPVSLGNNRLRTETAALVAVHTIALKNESYER